MRPPPPSPTSSSTPVSGASTQAITNPALSLIPAAFVLLWSTGFIGMRYGAPHAEPFTFMALRMMIVVGLLVIIVFATRAPWPRSWTQVGHLVVAGLLVHATYLGGILYAIRNGLPVGFVALIAGLQPILTALFASRWLGERLSGVQSLGMACGFMGVVMVVASKYALVSTGTVNTAPPAIIAIAFASLGLLGITFGTLYQKRFCAEMDLRTGGVVQFSATLAAMALLAFVFETRVVQWHVEFVFALFWLAIVLSLGAISLLYWMIRRGAASKVASLFFLTPSVTALMGFVLFGETFSPLAIAGLVVTSVGVALVTKK